MSAPPAAVAGTMQHGTALHCIALAAWVAIAVCLTARPRVSMCVCVYRGYAEKKITENIDAEIAQVCLDEVGEDSGSRGEGVGRGRVAPGAAAIGPSAVGRRHSTTCSP